MDIIERIDRTRRDYLDEIALNGHNTYLNEIH